MNGPVTDALKLSRLPKWAQDQNKDQTRIIEHLRNQVKMLSEDQIQRKNWHTHTIKTSDMGDGKINTRFFVASDIDIELDNGLRLNINPTHDGEVRMYFSVERTQRRDAEAVIVPGAPNAITLRKMYNEPA